MNNPYQTEEVKQFNYKLGHIGERIVSDEINRFDGYSTVKTEFACPDYKIFINGNLAGYAEVKTQKARDVLNNGRKIGYSFKVRQIENYRSYDTPETPLEFYVVDIDARLVRWDYFSELERTRDIDGREFPFDAYAKSLDAEMHHWHVSQFRFAFPLNDADIAEIEAVIDERDKFIEDLKHNGINYFREQRMKNYLPAVTCDFDGSF